MFGEKIGHGTPFRRAIEDGIVSPHHMVQIGLRGGAGGLDDVIDNLKWGREQVSVCGWVWVRVCVLCKYPVPAVCL